MLIRAPHRRGLKSTDCAIDAGRELPAGSHIVTPRFGYAHHGIYVGRGRVVHYGGLSRALRRGPVEEVPLEQFAQGRPVFLRTDDDTGGDREEVVRRALIRLGEDRYRVLTNNCEHFCEWCTRGVPRSYQVEEIIARYKRTWRRFMERLTRAFCVARNSALNP